MRRPFLTRAQVYGACLVLASLWPCPLLAATAAGTLTFGAPSLERPSYRIEFPFAVQDAKVSIKDVRINGSKVESFLAFKDGKNVAVTAPLEAGAYTIVLDFAWRAATPYRVSLAVQPEQGPKPETVEAAGLSPRTGGIPGGRDGFYRIYQIEEEAGLDRDREIVSLALVASKAGFDPSEIVLFDGPKSVPFEILETMPSVPPEAVSATHPVTTTVKIAASIGAKAYEKKLLLVLKGDPRPAPAAGIAVSGEGLGRTIKSSKLALELHPQSGQINTIESLEAGIKLFNKAGVIHWNPDVFVPGIAWDHSFDWKPPAIAEEKIGGSVYLNSRRGPLPRIKGVMLDVRYAVEADAPYFISETRMTFEEGLGVIAVRNDEMVLFRELFDSLLYRDKRGKIVSLSLKEMEGAPFGLAHVAPEDLGWVGLVNSREGFGFFSLRLQSAHGNLELTGELLHRPGTYFYAPSDGNYVYWVRPLVYTWGDFFTNNLLAFVPKGSFFYEKNAYIVMRTGDDLPGKLDLLLQRLRKPLRVL